jgi:lactate dehydrogenase-like 2-hydroxyacid dehydrogenase
LKVFIVLSWALVSGALPSLLDVYENEPRVHPALVDLPNVVLLPHLGSATIEARTAMGMKVADNLDRFFAGEPLLDPVS